MSWFTESERNEELPNDKWRKVSFDLVGGCWARLVSKDDNVWDLSVGLPADTDPDPTNLRVGCIVDPENNQLVYTVAFKPRDINVFKLLTLNGRSEKGNSIRIFSVHIGNDIERTFEPKETDLDNNNLENL